MWCWFLENIFLKLTWNTDISHARYNKLQLLQIQDISYLGKKFSFQTNTDLHIT